MDTTAPAHVIRDAARVSRFITAGKSFFTLSSLKTGQRFTFKVRKSDDKAGWAPAWFVYLLTGSENTGSYSYMGYIDTDGDFKLTRKSKVPATATSVSAFRWLWTRVSEQGKDLPTDAEFRHANRCGRCGKVLTVPESVDSGYGPECITMVPTSVAPRPRTSAPKAPSAPVAPAPVAPAPAPVAPVSDVSLTLTDGRVLVLGTHDYDVFRKTFAKDLLECDSIRFTPAEITTLRDPRTTLSALRDLANTAILRTTAA